MERFIDDNQPMSTVSSTFKIQYGEIYSRYSLFYIIDFKYLKSSMERFIVVY